MTTFDGFPKDTIEFLTDLRDNNNRDWFNENKTRYEQSFVQPSLQLIEALQRPLGKIAPMLKVEPKRMGGSLMRIYKDTRFSNDKTPYKTNIGIQFRHAAGKDVHAPGVYVHIDPDECFFGAGAWRPDSPTLLQFRTAIVEKPAAWKRATRSSKFSATFNMYDDRLKTPPRGFDKEHPLVEDLRLKSFLCACTFERSMVESAELVREIPKLVKAAAPLMAFLCEAMGQPY